ncbi:MAG: hypothetical protein KGD65_00690, partial [Candidatus Lokiarchaeota archaeon]|nr:hypothetical protein [Candidatus Lokiarchaeota archaeon]
IRENPEFNFSNSSDLSPTQEDVWKIKKLESEREKYIKECASLGIEYNEEKLNELKKKIEDYG